MEEKRGNAQLARMLKATLPNEWTYDQVAQIARKYINDNFVSQGMCADWTIHDSANDKGQRNLHFHAMFTLHPIDEKGKWGAKSRKASNPTFSDIHNFFTMLLQRNHIWHSR